MSGNPVGWFEIYVQDMARARAFYEAVLGVKLEALPVPDGGFHAVRIEVMFYLTRRFLRRRA